jgi:tRNA dimethylallyltransferase
VKPLVLVLGPTGSGKSALALDIAEQFGGEIVNCDSLQFYRGFDIGTAKATAEERRRAPHHLFDILEPHQAFTAGDYARVARPVLREIAGRGRVPVVVGGTGFYVRALLEGLFPGPPRHPALRERLGTIEERRAGFLHRALSRFDLEAAARIHANDRNKLIRALEVCLAARQPMTALFEEGRDPLTGFAPVRVALDPPRSDLYHKLDRRCLHMLEAGLIQEIVLLLLAGISSDSKPFESIGYKESLGFLHGDLTLPAALDLMRRNTRRYAKRQLTWFRKEPNVQWMCGFGTDPEVRRSVLNMLVKYLHNLE